MKKKVLKFALILLVFVMILAGFRFLLYGQFLGFVPFLVNNVGGTADNYQSAISGSSVAPISNNFSSSIIGLIIILFILVFIAVKFILGHYKRTTENKVKSHRHIIKLDLK